MKREEELHDHDRGLSFDLPTLARRRMIRWMVAGSLVPLVGCASEDDTTASASSSSTSSSSTSSAASTAGAECAKIPEETAGPYPGDGSNGPNVLSESGVVRKDITTSFGSASGTAEGVPLTINLTLVNSSDGCGTALAGAAVYLWHCDRDGNYSLYSQGVTDQNYLRGVQEADSDGKLTFTSIFPACYTGRWPHIHFEVYPSLDAATSGSDRSATSQLALPKDVCDLVYATDGYSQSVQNLGRLSLETDNIFSDGSSQQMATLTGSVEKGYTATLQVAV